MHKLSGVLISRTLTGSVRPCVTRPLPPSFSSRPHVKIAQQWRSSSFLNERTRSNAKSSQSKPIHESWFSRKRKERGARKKISTLALDSQSLLSDVTILRDGQNDQGSRHRILAKRRKLLMWAALLTMPLWGRDALEVVVPGCLGVFILCAGKVKAGVNTIRTTLTKPSS